jgi:antitoxin VapB
VAEAVNTALRERLERVERYQRLKALASGSRELMREPYLSIEHGDLLYDENGLPK